MVLWHSQVTVQVPGQIWWYTTVQCGEGTAFTHTRSIYIKKILSIHKTKRCMCKTLIMCGCGLKPLTLMYMEPPVLINSIQRQGEHTEKGKWKVQVTNKDGFI